MSPGVPHHDASALNATRTQSPASRAVDEKTRIFRVRSRLPIYSHRLKLIQKMAVTDNLIILSETGSGKTTQIPQFIHDAELHSRGVVAVTQPRRLAAITVAERVAHETQCPVGDVVGYSVRFDEACSSRTKIKYMTDGMLLREALLDPDLMKYRYVVLDEAHERSLQTDILFGIIKRAQERRERMVRAEKDVMRLQTVTMSATMDADMFSKFWGNAPVLYICGREYPVEQHFVKEKVEDYVFGCLVTCIEMHRHLSLSEGILIFLTGQEEIEAAIASLKNVIKEENMRPASVMPLYASLPNALQKEAFKRVTPGHRKIIVATNVAEASVTIMDIKHVIDSGRAKIKTFNPVTGIEVLAVQKISKGQCLQRAGRAGRLGPGTYRLMMTTEEFDARPELPEPEIRRCNLNSVVLQLLALNVYNLYDFPFIDRPSKAALRAAIRQLWQLDAVNVDDLKKCKSPCLTLDGRLMVGFPLDPKFARMVLAASKLGCMSDMLSVVSVLSSEPLFLSRRERDPSSNMNGSSQNEVCSDPSRTRAKFESVHGDLPTYLNAFDQYKRINQPDARQFCADNWLNHRALSYAAKVRSQLHQVCRNKNLKSVSQAQERELKLCEAICEGLFMNCAERQADGSYLIVGRQDPVFIHPSSVLFGRTPECVVFVELVKTSKNYMRHVTRIDKEWMKEKLPRVRQVFAVAEKHEE